MRLIWGLTVLILALSCAALAGPSGDMPGKAPGDQMHQLKPGMLRMPNPAPWVKVTLDAVWLQDAHSKYTMPNASGVLTGAQTCPVALNYKATLISTSPNVTVGLVLSDGTTVAVNLPPAGTPKSGNYTFRFTGSADVTKPDPNAPKPGSANAGIGETLKTLQVHLQVLTPKTFDPASTPSSKIVTVSGAQCAVACTIDGCGYAK